MIVLDTHAWLWWLHDPRALGRAAKRRIQEEIGRGEALVSVISVWEIATKTHLGKLKLPMELDAWFVHARSYPGIALVPLEPDDAIESTRLPGTFHRDPADRIIVALARRLGVPVATRDAAIQGYDHVQTLW